MSVPFCSFDVSCFNTRTFSFIGAGCVRWGLGEDLGDCSLINECINLFVHATWCRLLNVLQIYNDEDYRWLDLLNEIFKESGEVNYKFSFGEAGRVRWGLGEGCFWDCLLIGKEKLIIFGCITWGYLIL